MHTARQEHNITKVKEEEYTEEIDELASSSSLSCPEVSEPFFAIVVAIAGLLEVALHNILYLRQVYPNELFERRKKFGIAVFQCMEETVNEYISEVISAVSSELLEDAVSNFTICIHQSDTPLEKFIFSFVNIKSSEDENANSDIIPLDELQCQMRTMLLKLNGIDAMLLPLESYDELSFSVVMHLRERERSFHITEDELNFGLHEEDDVESRKQERKEGMPRAQFPALIHIIDSGNLHVSFHVEEAEAKLLPLASKFSKNKCQAKPEIRRNSSSNVSSRSSIVDFPA